MSRAIGSFLILILVTQQTYCQNDFERQILQRLEKLEKAKEDLETRLFSCSRVIDDTLQTLQQKEVENEKFKEKVLELQSLSASEKSCFQLALQGINKSGRFLLDPDGHHLNHPPMEVECKFPSNLTLIHSIFSMFPIGEEIEKEFERCNSPKCSEIPVRYRAHIDQILKLIEDSGSCSQELQFHCNNGTFTNLFSWTDKEGLQHAMTHWACDIPDSTWNIFTLNVTDKGQLPIKEVKLSPLQHGYEQGTAKVVIGPIICEPPPLDQRPKFSIEHRLNALEGSKEEEIKCPRVNVTENSSDHGTFVNGIYEISNEKNFDRYVYKHESRERWLFTCEGFEGLEWCIGEDSTFKMFYYAERRSSGANEPWLAGALLRSGGMNVTISCA